MSKLSQTDTITSTQNIHTIYSSALFKVQYHCTIMVYITLVCCHEYHYLVGFIRGQFTQCHTIFTVQTIQFTLYNMDSGRLKLRSS